LCCLRELIFILLDQYVIVKWNSKHKNMYTSYGYTFTKINDEFSIHISHLPKFSHVVIKFQCDECNEIFSRKYAKYTQSRNRFGKDLCNKCVRKQLNDEIITNRTKRGVNLADKHPEVARFWDQKKNGTLTPKDVTPKSVKVVWWVCEEDHSYEMPISRKTQQHMGCPDCRFKSLSEMFPTVALEWHKKLNGDLKPSDVSYGSKKTVWWNAPCGHEWDMSIKERTLNGNGCPFCSKRRVNESNNILATHPEIAAQWHPTKNIGNPKEYTIGSNKHAWWLCAKCNGEWKTAIRARQITGCPHCCESKAEQRISKYLDSQQINYVRQVRFSDCRNKRPLPFDFGIYNEKSELIFLLEFDGGHHFYPRRDDKDGSRLEEQFKKDRIKTSYCIANDILLYRISFRDHEILETILSQLLNFHIYKTIAPCGEFLSKYQANNSVWSHDGYMKQVVNM
jgi:hypothetical protein